MEKENIIYGETTEEYKAIKWLENKTTNYSDDGLTLHYNLLLYNLIINLQHQLKKKQDIIDKVKEYNNQVIKDIKDFYKPTSDVIYSGDTIIDIAEQNLDILKEVK